MPTIETTYGPIEGRNEHELNIFRGIPYAKPPVGNLRFRPPQPMNPWSKPIQAHEFGPAAPQIASKLSPDTAHGMSEDCLSLNIWTPECDDKKRLVMFWIHGGSFMVGSSKNDVSEGSRLATRGDVVVVSINYRMGAFGFLHLAETGGEDYATSGNLGLLDQIAALEWVRDNIANFGGDPDSVTVFGCSAGGISIAALLAMPAARGLFHRAITQSGASLARSADSASTAARELMKHAGVDNIDGLRALPMEQLIDAQASALAASPKPDVFFGPVVDGISLPEFPLHAIHNGHAMNVPLLAGTTLDEMRYWILSNPAIVNVAPDKLMHVIRRLVGERAESVLETHRATRPDASEADITVAILSDINFTLPTTRMVESHAQHQPNTWRYLFTWASPAQGGLLGSPHAIEQPFVFGNLSSNFASIFLKGGEGLEALSDRVQDAWLAFAKTGDPNHTGLPEWPTYDAERRAVMQFNDECSLADDPHGNIRQLWDGVPFDGISPPVGIRPIPRN